MQVLPLMPAIRIFPNLHTHKFAEGCVVHLLRMHERSGATTCTKHLSTGLPGHLRVSLHERGCRLQRLVSILRLLGFASLATDAGERCEVRLTPVESVKARMNSLHSHVKGTREFPAFTCA